MLIKHLQYCFSMVYVKLIKFQAYFISHFLLYSSKFFFLKTTVEELEILLLIEPSVDILFIIKIGDNPCIIIRQDQFRGIDTQEHSKKTLGNLAFQRLGLSLKTLINFFSLYLSKVCL